MYISRVPEQECSSQVACGLAVASDVIIVRKQSDKPSLLSPDLHEFVDTYSGWVVLDAPSTTDAAAADAFITTSISLLDGGVSKLVLNIKASVLTAASNVISTVIIPKVSASLPLDRIILRLDGGSKSDWNGFVDAFASLAVYAVIVPLTLDASPFPSSESAADGKLPSPEQQATVAGIKQFVKKAQQGQQCRVIFDLPTSGTLQPSYSLIGGLDKLGADLIIDMDNFVNGKKLDAGEAIAACLVTDRPDGLYPTVVVDEQLVSLGLAYSSAKSISETIRLCQGVYQSRTRGLWYKGATSGATQQVHKILFDCDKDTIQFVVSQNDPGYCHLNTRSCFGHDSGITALARLLRQRKTAAPVGSYTRRLYEDPKLLRSKILEEAHELCDAETKEDIAWETADLIYFALVKCASADVSLSDIEKQLARRAKKVSRRPGNAKPQFMEGGAAAASANGVPPSVTTPVASTPVTTPATSKPVESPIAIKMKHFNLSSLNETEATQLLQRPIVKSDEILSKVRPIVEDVRKRGDQALIDLTLKFDNVKLESPVIKAPFDKSLMQLDPKVKDAIDAAFENIKKFHEAQLEKEELEVETMEGVVCRRFWRPIERVGLYVPGGTAILPSSTMMLGVPAMVAVGASAIVLSGGAQAVAAMAFGTDSVPKVDKIAGPGNQFVTAAKMILQNDSSAMISIDMPAGPSELLVIADENSNPAYVASDLLSQAEHGVDSQVVLVAVNMSATHLADIEREVSEQGERLPRSDIVRVSISKSFIVSVPTLAEAIKFSNSYAPEHLILHIDEAENAVKDVVNAGSIFVGPWSPESCGDYASGTNHTLPTYGYARMYSGVNTHTFVKHITSQMLTKEGLDKLGDIVTTLAEIEGLEAHRNAVAIRLKDIRANRA
ncbi:trifunctional histidinol dehydrogenase [Blyttiomyces sp. JEL0837]|nr:trifunctional histidinol dehydrogenase [Blyttiomyces sp. JEL0837]